MKTPFPNGLSLSLSLKTRSACSSSSTRSGALGQRILQLRAVVVDPPLSLSKQLSHTAAPSIPLSRPATVQSRRSSFS
ncbi:hypothetical protein CRG98_038272 [Punica granatum]|uniref:Uncharacterized protein n=1 Tax=Punica granatum TaxID=22663 RepID=A0A2I0IBH0_PUNGR|nr:hypothetical protein CRG98_038272 [Punica granatum]